MWKPNNAANLYMVLLGGEITGTAIGFNIQLTYF